MQKCLLARKRSYLTEKGLFSRKAKPVFGYANPAEHWRQRLEDGLSHNLSLVIAKAVHGQSAASRSSADLVRQAALFGTRNRDGWDTGLTILTALGQLLPFLSEEETHLALFHGVRRVAADCDGLSPLRRRVIEDMRVRNLSPATQRCYVHAVAKFAQHFNRSPDRLGWRRSEPIKSTSPRSAPPGPGSTSRSARCAFSMGPRPVSAHLARCGAFPDGHASHRRFGKVFLLYQKGRNWGVQNGKTWLENHRAGPLSAERQSGAGAEIRLLAALVRTAHELMKHAGCREPVSIRLPHITSLLAPPVLRLARLNLPVGTFEFANSIRPFSSTRPAIWLQCNV